MFYSGSDVAKEAAALILLNNDFESIPVAIESGRLVFDNLKKVILYLMPVNPDHSFLLMSPNVSLAGWNLHGVRHCLLQRLSRHAACFEFIPPSMFLYNERRHHVYLVDVRKARIR